MFQVVSSRPPPLPAMPRMANSDGHFVGGSLEILCLWRPPASGPLAGVVWQASATLPGKCRGPQSRAKSGPYTWQKSQLVSTAPGISLCAEKLPQDIVGCGPHRAQVFRFPRPRPSSHPKPPAPFSHSLHVTRSRDPLS